MSDNWDVEQIRSQTNDMGPILFPVYDEAFSF